MRRSRICIGAVSAAAALVLVGCAGSDAGPGEAKGVDGQLLAMPTIDDTDGLVIDGERIADADLLRKAREENSVVLYTAAGPESVQMTTERFTAETGIAVEITRLPGSALAERVLSEAGAGRGNAGVVTITDPVIAEKFAAEGVYSMYETPNFEQLKGAPRTVWNDGQYYTAYSTVYSLGYNSSVLTEGDAPKSWQDLVDPEWADGKLGVVNAGSGGSSAGLAYFHLQEFGEEYLRRTASLEPRVFDSVATQLEALARGEIEIMSGPFSSIYSAELLGAPVKAVVPEEGVSATFNMQGLTEAGRSSPGAQLYMNWTMSAAGQKFYAAQGYVPSRSDVGDITAGDYKLPAADSDKFHVYTPEDAEAHGEETVARWNEIFEFGAY